MRETLKKYIVAEENSILEVVQQIDIGGKGIAFVCQNDKLLAAITDGDIRRFLIAKGDLTTPIRTIANYKPYFLCLGDEKEAIALMEELVITAIPILDGEGNIVDIKFLMDKEQQQYEQLNVPVVIMAGGKGTRLKPYTDILPKPLIPIGEQTITEHIMEQFVQYGCTDFTMIVNYQKNFIKAYFSDKTIDEDKKLQIKFVDESIFLGTGGGLGLLKNKIKETFFMTNCDILIKSNYSKMLQYHKESKNIITMVCVRKHIVIPYGIVEIDEHNRAMSIQEKPQFDFNTNTGFYIIEPDFLDIIQEETFVHITDLMKTCIENGKKVGVYMVEEDQWMDMGQLEELEKMKGKLQL